jgi:predicted TIM-barrel fold metal-dependent hydrolase
MKKSLAPLLVRSTLNVVPSMVSPSHCTFIAQDGFFASQISDIKIKARKHRLSSFASSSSRSNMRWFSKKTGLEVVPSAAPQKLAFVSEDDGLLRLVPTQAWDSHIHVLDPSRFPLAPNARYTPNTHTLSHALTLESSLGFWNVVLVQPSIYGYDNSCLLDALRAIGPRRGRGVVALDLENAPSRLLTEWNELGVCGIRLNLKSTGEALKTQALEDMLRKCSEIARPLGWVLQLYIDMEYLPLIEEVVMGLPVRVVFDHFGCPSLPPSPSRKLRRKLGTSSLGQSLYDPYEVPGFVSLVNLLRSGNTFVKLSGAYRFSGDHELRDAEVIAKELFRVAPTRVVFATDWPHTRFEGLDVKPFVTSCIRWCCGDLDLVERVFRENAEDLWRVP